MRIWDLVLVFLFSDPMFTRNVGWKIPAKQRSQRSLIHNTKKCSTTPNTVSRLAWYSYNL